MIRTLFIAVLATLFLNNLSAQKLTTAQVENLINTKHYSFVATTVNPLRGTQKFLTQNYFLKVANDSLVSQLPYFGVAYTAPVDPSDAGYDFTSTSFDYTVTPKKKGGYEVAIHTKDKMNTTDFALTIYSNGKAVLRASSTQKQPISYNGYIKSAEK
jgi:uncharacterized protein DUF4251